MCTSLVYSVLQHTYTTLNYYNSTVSLWLIKTETPALITFALIIYDSRNNLVCILTIQKALGGMFCQILIKTAWGSLSGWNCFLLISSPAARSPQNYWILRMTRYSLRLSHMPDTILSNKDTKLHKTQPSPGGVPCSLVATDTSSVIYIYIIYIYLYLLGPWKFLG